MRAVRKASFIAGITISIIFAILYLPPTQYRLTNILTVEKDIYPVHAIVVLGGGLDADGNLGISTRERLNYGIHLFKLGLGEYLIVSGGDRKSGKVEAEEMHKVALTRNIPDEVIVQEPYSLNTHENALYTKQILSRYPIQEEVILVTSPYHMKRAFRCFEQKEIKTLPVPVKNSEIYSYGLYQSFRNARLLVREILAFVWYKYQGWI